MKKLIDTLKKILRWLGVAVTVGETVEAAKEAEAVIEATPPSISSAASEDVIARAIAEALAREAGKGR